MKISKDQENQFFYLKIIQSGEFIRIELTDKKLNEVFKDIYVKLLKELKLKLQDSYLSNEQGKMVGDLDLDLPLKDIIKKFGNKLKLYYEKIF